MLKEVLKRYEFDGVFLDAPDYGPYFCESCRKKHRQVLDEELPMERENGKNIATFPTFTHRKGIKGVREEWESLCYKDNIRLTRENVQVVSSGTPLILYFKTHSEDLDTRVFTVDMLCTEAQDIFSQGIENITPSWLLSLNVKYGSVLEYMPAPFSIIHSCPGVGWRHAELLGARHQSWMSRIAANDANLWHSLTGFKETIGDQRLLRTTKAVNQDAV